MVLGLDEPRPIPNLERENFFFFGTHTQIFSLASLAFFSSEIDRVEASSVGERSTD